MKKRNMICLAGLLVIALVPVGCGKDKEPSYEAEADIQTVAKDAEYGEVASVSDNVITIKEGTLKDREDMTDEGRENDASSKDMGRMHGGNIPEGTPPADMQKEDRPDNMPEGTPPADMQKGDRPDDMPEGTPPADMQQGRPEDEEISISDINEGDVVSVTYNDDGSAAEISVISMARRER